MTRLLLENAREVFSRPLNRSPAKLSATEHRLSMLHSANGNVAFAGEAAQCLWKETTSSLPPTGSSEDVALKYETLNTTD